MLVEIQSEKYLDAMRRYNARWSSFAAYQTRTLYARAARSVSFGCHLQDEVLHRMGAPVAAHKSRAHYGKAAEAWMAWMLAA